MSEGIRARLPVASYVDGVLQGDRAVLSRTITIAESHLPSDRELAVQILEAILPSTGKSHRIGITGIPGAGKSTFLDSLGMYLLGDRAVKIAVLTVDPSSSISGGSILGDKTRMERLVAEENAFIRPSPARGHLGGVAPKTREAILLCEAAGFTHVFIETVGVGQSETEVRSMTDFFLLLAIPGAGDELQGIKRGIFEMLDALVFNKADGDNVAAAERAGAEFSSALRLFPPRPDGWIPCVLSCSALTGTGVPEVWDCIRRHREQQIRDGWFDARRKDQSVGWMNAMILEGLVSRFRNEATVQSLLRGVEEEVYAGRISPATAAAQLLEAFQAATCSGGTSTRRA